MSSINATNSICRWADGEFLQFRPKRYSPLGPIFFLEKALPAFFSFENSRTLSIRFCVWISIYVYWNVRGWFFNLSWSLKPLKERKEFAYLASKYSSKTSSRRRSDAMIQIANIGAYSRIRHRWSKFVSLGSLANYAVLALIHVIFKEVGTIISGGPLRADLLQQGRSVRWFSWTVASVKDSDWFKISLRKGVLWQDLIGVIGIIDSSHNPARNDPSVRSGKVIWEIKVHQRQLLTDFCLGVTQLFLP